jgi:hypothetical protein
MTTWQERFHVGQRVEYLGQASHRGTIRGISKQGVRVRWDNGSTDLVHPDDVQVVK